MGKTSENRLRRLERDHRPPRYREVSFGWRTEEEYVRLIALGRRALAGDKAAEELFERELALPPPPPPAAAAGRSGEALVGSP